MAPTLSTGKKQNPGVRPGLLTATLLAVCLGGCASAPPGAADRPLPAYVDDAACAECHRQQFEDWTGSHHDLAMQDARVESVLGDFEATFTHFGVTSRFFTENGRFFVNTEGPDGELADFEIAYTFGVDPLQQYLIASPGGRLQALSIAWDVERGRWFHLYPDERIRPGDPLHWTGPYQNWNFMCAECHSTSVQKNYDPQTRSYRTRWEAIDVGCQSCHGPGGVHVQWAGQTGPDAGAAVSPGLVVDFGNNGSVYQVESCAPCHSRRRQISTEARAGEPLLDHFMPETLDEGLYHPDGQVLEEVYVYGSFLQSRMYAEGVACSDCHNPHSLGLRVRGNAVCEQCHRPDAPRDRFPALASKDYSSPGHHFHPAGSDGAQCVNCHMPERTYMVVDPRRDHSFRIPRPDLSVSLGTPNACNDCHSGQTPQWAAAAVDRWYGARGRETPHYGATLAAGRRAEPEARAELAALAADPDAASIVRATALSLLRAYGPGGLSALAAALEDPEPLLRATAAGGLDQAPPEERLRLLAPLLRDPVRSVRLEAAPVLARLPADALPAADRGILEDLLAEYEAVQMSLGETAPAHLNLGVLHSARGLLDRAVEDYETALALQPDFAPASLNLATLFNQMGRNGDARRVLRDAIALSPEEGELHYSMGLLLAEMGQFNAAVESLGRSAALLPERPRVRYNYALVLQRLGRRAQAETELERAYRMDPADGEVLQALAIFYAQDERWSEALRMAEELVEMLPAEDGARQFLETLRREARRP